MDNLYDQLSNELDSFDPVPKAPLVKSTGSGGSMIPQRGNPAFTVQIDLNVSLILSRALGNAPTVADQISFTVEEIIPADLAAAVKTAIPVFLFGNSDFSAAYKRSDQLSNKGNWKFLGARIIEDNVSPIDVVSEDIFSNGNSTIVGFPSEAVRNKKASIGDMVLTYSYLAIEGTIGDTDAELQIAEVVIKCPQVAYGTLLDSVSSDTFKVNGFRYTVQDITKIAQFDNSVELVRQSMFGKLSTDSINPNAMKLPSNQQDNIIDVPLVVGIDKNQLINTSINYDVDQFTWSLFIPSVRKIKA